MMPARTEPVTLPERCPACSSPDTRILVWGMPVEMPDPDLYRMAGCSINFDAGEPQTFVCIGCDHRWG
jgi:hypothetical protein